MISVVQGLIRVPSVFRGMESVIMGRVKFVNLRVLLVRAQGALIAQPASTVNTQTLVAVVYLA